MLEILTEAYHKRLTCRPANVVRDKRLRFGSPLITGMETGRFCVALRGMPKSSGAEVNISESLVRRKRVITHFAAVAQTTSSNGFELRNVSVWLSICSRNDGL